MRTTIWKVLGSVVLALMFIHPMNARWSICRASDVRTPNERVAGLLDQLQSGDPRIRREAVKALGEVNIADTLVKVLCEDSDFSVCSAAAEALKKLHWQPSTPRENVIYLLVDGKREELAARGAIAVDILVELLGRGDISMKARAAEGLGIIGDPRAIDALVKCLSAGEKTWQNDAVGALGRIRDPRAFQFLLDRLLEAAAKLSASGNGYSRVFDLAQALGCHGKSAVGPLGKLLTYKNLYVRCAAAAGLGKTRDPSATELLLNALDDKDDGVRQWAAKSLQELGFKAQTQDVQMKLLLANLDWDGIISSGEKGVEVLIRALGDEDHDFRLWVAQALAKSRNPKAIAPLTEALRDDFTDWYREGIARALGDMWPVSKEVIPLLLDSLKAGNLGAVWILHKDDTVAKEAVSTTLAFMIESTAKREPFKRELLQNMTKERLMQLSRVLAREDYEFLEVLFSTNQSVPRGMTDMGLEDDTEYWDHELAVSRLLEDRLLCQRISLLLGQVSPDRLQAYFSCVVTVCPDAGGTPLGALGQRTWASYSLAEMIEAFRSIELARECPLIKLMAQSGNIKIPRETWARFEWSRAPSIRILLPPLLWSEDDVPGLERLRSSKHEAYRRMVEQALAEIQKERNELQDPQSLLHGLSDIDFNRRYSSLHALSERESIPGEFLAPLIRALDERNWWIHKVTTKCLIKIGEPAVRSLTGCLKEPKDKQWYVRFSAAPVLGEIGDNQSLESLSQAINNQKDALKGSLGVPVPEYRVMQATEQAIKRIKERHPQGNGAK